MMPYNLLYSSPNCQDDVPRLPPIEQVNQYRIFDWPVVARSDVDIFRSNFDALFTQPCEIFFGTFRAWHHPECAMKSAKIRRLEKIPHVLQTREAAQGIPFEQVP